jgi:hypothetical protein
MFYSDGFLDRLGKPPTVTFSLKKAIFHSLRTTLLLDDRIRDFLGLLWKHDLVFCPLKHLYQKRSTRRRCKRKTRTKSGVTIAPA